MTRADTTQHDTTRDDSTQHNTARHGVISHNTCYFKLTQFHAHKHTPAEIFYTRDPQFRMFVCVLVGWVAAQHDYLHSEHNNLDLLYSIFYFDVVFDTVGGVSNTFNCALSYVIPNGQIIKLGWFMGKNKELNLDAIIRKSISVKGSFSHNFKIWEKCIKLVKNKKINLRKIIGRVDDLKNWKNSFNDVINKKYVKIILRS